jgi:glycerol-3-phosphate dehydrogenase (NAD(P)+)
MRGGPVGVIGAGAWGTAFAIHLARIGVPVRLWVREEGVLRRIRSRRDNARFLPGIPVPEAVSVTPSLAEAASEASLVVLMVPTPFARSVYRDLAPHLPPETPAAVAAKGIEDGSLDLPLAVARGELGSDRGGAVLSGPSFAAEVARGTPTALVVASEDRSLATSIQDRLSSETLRLYTNEDVVGVQIAGALKNVIAIAAGVAAGLGLGGNTGAALLTRGIAEIARLGVALGGKSETFSGLAGLGDLVLTCTGDLSRNRGVGLALGRGERLEDVLRQSVHVAEGVRTARTARLLAERHGVEMPIVEEVCRLLDDETSPAEAVRRLMLRPLVPEDAGPTGRIG